MNWRWGQKIGAEPHDEKRNWQVIKKQTRLFFKSWWPDLLVYVGAGLFSVCMATLNSKSSLIPCLFFICSVLFVIVGLYYKTKQKDNVRNLKETLTDLSESMQIAEQAMDGFFDDLLAYIASTWCSCNANDRVTLYTHHDDSFNQIARYAEVPEYKIAGRKIIPANQGAIGLAWRSTDEIFYKGDIPDPIDAEERYYACLSDMQITQDVAENMSMKSRTFAIFHVKHPRMGRVALLVFESLVPNAFDIDELKAFWSWGDSVIRHMLEGFEPVLMTMRTK